MIESILDRYRFDSQSSLVAFLDDVVLHLTQDMRPHGGTTLRIADQLRGGQTLQSLYQSLFSLDYLKPRYVLRLGGKELHELSPGERGSLLLIFYLLVDKDDSPLAIDQPEENLDNQTVYELLVPCIREAKARRQILMVTHNPNLAVVSDAEQVIFAQHDKVDNHKVTYASGALENPVINRRVVDVLEGTMPAFDTRDKKYLPQS